MKIAAFFRSIGVYIVAIGYLVGSIFMGNGFDSVLRYKHTIKTIDCYENTLKEAVPQTEMYRFISEHFESDLPAGKTEKKAIVIGYDGCRADMLSIIDDEHPSAIKTVLDEGGNAFLTYCGGRNFPDWNSQATSTAPGWCSMLTGVWADKNLVSDNDIVKSDEYPTLLLSLVEDKTIDASAFYVSWGGHFSGDDATYVSEKNYIEKNGINANYVCASGDEGTRENVLADINKADCSDFIFSIFEYPDHVGHGSGFSPYNEEYPAAFYDAEQTGVDILNAIKSRPTYATEDWLIIITADHGGSTYGHGGTSIMERMTFVVANKDVL